MKSQWFMKSKCILSSRIFSNEYSTIKVSGTNEIYGTLNGVNVSDSCGFNSDVTKRLLLQKKNDIFFTAVQIPLLCALRRSAWPYLILLLDFSTAQIKGRQERPYLVLLSLSGIELKSETSIVSNILLLWTLEMQTKKDSKGRISFIPFYVDQNQCLTFNQAEIKVDE